MILAKGWALTGTVKFVGSGAQATNKSSTMNKRVIRSLYSV